MITFFAPHLPPLFSSCASRMVFSLLTALIFTIAAGPWFISRLYGLKVGRAIRVRDCPVLGPLHEKKKETPTMGGTLFICSLILSMLLWMDLRSPFTSIFFITLIVMGGLGGIDDYRKIKKQNKTGLSPRVKMVLQCALALGITYALYLINPRARFGGALVENTQQIFFFPFWKKALCFSAASSFFLSSFVIVGGSNAVNLTDGLDGLASGCVLFVAGVFALFAFLANHAEVARYLNLLYIEGSGEVAVFMAALFGSCLGFLWFNSYPAQVMMGDMGSLTLGALLGVGAVMLRREFLLALVGGVFVIETLSVIMQVTYFRFSGGKRIFLCAPLHHHFEYKGMPERKVVIRFWILGFILAIVGVASIKLQ